MGDTFTDDWQDEVPSSIGEGCMQFQFDDRENSKWEGNYYRYVREVGGGSWNDERHTITLRSYSPRKFDLRAVISLRKPGFEFNISTFSGDPADYYDPQTGRHLTPNKKDGGQEGPEIPWLPAVKFSSIEECLQVAYSKYLEILPVFMALQPGPGWEGNT